MKKHRIVCFTFLLMLFASTTAFSQIEYCYDWDAYIYGYSQILHDDQKLLVSGIAGTDISVFDYTPWFCDHDFDAWVYSELANNGGILSYGRLESPTWSVEGEHGTFNAQYGIYCVTSAHGLVDYWNYDDGKILHFFIDEYLALYTQSCHTFVPQPTPTPTPQCLDCQDVQATIGPIEVIEKYNVADVPITVSNAVDQNGQPLTTTFSIRTSNGTTGSATFENGSTSVSFQGNVQNQNLKIKGVTESNQVDNIIIEAKYTNRVLASDNFTVAVITSLPFDRINSGDDVIDCNPGTDGMPEPNCGEGQRIFPDKNNPNDTTDRSIIQVKAEVSPSMSNVKIYFASFDLDDPSANVAPIDSNDTTNASIGNDNNVNVNNSKSGDFIAPQGISCSPVTNVPANMPEISRIGCDISGSSAVTNYKVTMNPGDNFAVAASFSDIYRDGIKLDPTDGSKLQNSINQTIPVSGQINPNNVAGIRTGMLTVWRKLHIEVDSMGKVPGNISDPNINRVEGRITGFGLTNCPTPPGNCQVNFALFVDQQLDNERFQGGRIKVVNRTGTIDLKVLTNVTNTSGNAVILDGQPPDAANIGTGNSFTLYDDDDFNDSDGTQPDGDYKENLISPPHSLVEKTDTPCPDRLSANNCNMFAPAYIKPYYDLANPNPTTPFILNLPMSVDVTQVPAIAGEVQAAFRFDNAAYSDRDDFWAIYLSSAYQIDTRWDGDPNGTLAAVGITDSLAPTGQGCLLFLETSRPREASDWNVRPVNRDYTVAHEIGHKFGGTHGDGDLMTDSRSRRVGIFSDSTINKMRGGEFTDDMGTTRRNRHP